MRGSVLKIVAFVFLTSEIRRGQPLAQLRVSRSEDVALAVLAHDECALCLDDRAGSEALAAYTVFTVEVPAREPDRPRCGCHCTRLKAKRFSRPVLI